jgi:hypothetical protein
MISNIGFGPQATHTFDALSTQAAMHQHELTAISHPEIIGVNQKADQYERFNILIEPDGEYFLRRCAAALRRLRRILLGK